jgi:hypothetical protein
MVASFGVVAVDMAEEEEVVVMVVVSMMVDMVMGVSVLAAVTAALSAAIAVVAVEVVGIVVVVVVILGPLRWPLPLPTGRHGCSGLSCRARSKHASTVSLSEGIRREFCFILWVPFASRRVRAYVSELRERARHQRRKCTTLLAGSK